MARARAGRRRRVFVNEAYRPQRVSGQQRYAREISDRLPVDFVRVAPGKFWARSKHLTWLWVQLVLPLRTWSGVLLSMTARAPLWHPRAVLIVHDLFPLDHPEWFSRSFHLTHAPLLRFQLATCRVLVAVSEPVAQQLRSRRKRGRVFVAPNAPSPVFAAPSDGASDAVEKWSLTPGTYLVTVGNLEPRKNLARLAQAYATLSEEQRQNLPLVVVGGGAEVFRSVDVQWPKETILTGYVTDEELTRLYAGAKAVVFPSLAEGFGLPIVEASYAGTRSFVLSDIEVFRWICGDAAHYVDPESVESIAAGLLAAAAGRLPRTGFRTDRFTWEASARTIEQACAAAR